MKNSEIIELTTCGIIERISVTKEEYIRMCLNHSVNPLENPMKIRFTRRNIARLSTELRKRQLAN